MAADLTYLDLGCTFRANPPHETLQKLQALKEQIGVTRIADITGLDNIDIPVITVTRPMAKHLAISQGKGLTKELATISALMEAAESFHMENPPPASLIGSFDQLNSQHSLLDPEVCHASFLDKSKQLKKMDMHWAQAINLLDGQTIHIPHALTSLDSTIPRPDFSYFSVSTNGLAGGNTKSEALCHALYEVIERDALYQWGKKSAELRQHDLLIHSSIETPGIQALLNHLHERNFEIMIWDITSTLGIPAFNCVILDKSLMRNLSFFSGSGAHLSQEIALFRAILEAVQSRTSLISGSRDDIYKSYYLKQNIGLNNLQNLSRKKKLIECTRPEFTHSFENNVHQILEKLSLHGYDQVLCVEHTKEELNLPIVQVLIPGMSFGGSRM